MTNVQAFLTLHKHLGEKDSGLRRDEMEAAVSEMLRRAKIADLGEYMRSYKYRRRDLAPWQRQMLLGPGNPAFRVDGNVFLGSRELLGHAAHVERLCFDQGGRFFLSGSADGMVKLWDMASGLLVHSFVGHRSLVNDLCVSNDGFLLVSCDFFGLLNVWSLRNFRLLFQLHLGCEIIFAEFFSTEASMYNLAVVLAKGVVKTYRLAEEGVVSEFENLCLLDEAIKGLCFTDGGRFLLCGGWWPYLVLFDTQASEGCVVLETNGLPVNTICGAKHGLKVAAACEQQIYQWTFFTEGNPRMGNFKRRTKDTDLTGHWRRSVIKVEMDENEGIERICYLKDNYLVCVCTDLKIRIFAGTELRNVIDSQEMGVVYPHPLQNIFAFCGNHLRIYSLDCLVHEESLQFSVNDAQFSSDGDAFILGDERGVVRTLSMGFLADAPREQFFISDFDHINSQSEGFVECRKDATFSIARERNREWRQVEYRTTGSSSKCMEIEALGAQHFCRDFISLETFRKKYMNMPLPGETQSVEVVESSSSESTVDPVDTSSETTESSASAEEDEKRMPLRRLVIESDEEERAVPVEESGLRKRLRRFNRDGSGSSDELTVVSRRTRRNESRAGPGRSASISSLISRRRSEEWRDAQLVCSQSLAHNESELTQFVQSWLSSLGLVQTGDAVYFDAEALRDFQRFDTRKTFKNACPASGHYDVEDIEIVRHDPPFLKAVLAQGKSSFPIRFYRYPNAPPVLVLREQLAIASGDTVRFVSGDRVTSGTVVNAHPHDLVVSSEDSQVLVDRSDVLVSMDLFPRDVLRRILDLLKLKRAYRSLYVTQRRGSNVQYYERIASNISLGVVEEKMLNALYRSVEGLEYDLDVVVANSVHLGPACHRHCKQLAEEIKAAARRM